MQVHRNTANVVHTSLARPISRKSWATSLELYNKALTRLHQAVGELLGNNGSTLEQVLGCTWILVSAYWFLVSSVRCAPLLPG